MANKSKNNKQAPAKPAPKPSTSKPQTQSTGPSSAQNNAEKKTRVVRSARERLTDAPTEILKKLESVGAYLAKCQSTQARQASEIAKNARATMADLRDAIKVIPADDAPNASRDYVVGDVVKLTATRDLSGEGRGLELCTLDEIKGEWEVVEAQHRAPLGTKKPKDGETAAIPAPAPEAEQWLRLKGNKGNLINRKAVGHGVELVTPAPDSPSVNQDAELSDEDEDDDNESAD